MSKEAQITNEIFGLNLPETDQGSLAFIEDKLQPFVNEASKHPADLSTYIDFESLASDSEEGPWFSFANENYIDSHLLRVATILLVAIARINARKSFVDDNILKFYINLKNELSLYLRHQQKLQSLAPKDNAIIQYLAKRMAVSRLAEYEATLLDSTQSLTGDHSIDELRDFLL